MSKNQKVKASSPNRPLDVGGDPFPVDFDLQADFIDFSKWKVKIARRQKDLRLKPFYMIMRKDNRTFKIHLPNGDMIQTHVIWIE